MTYCCVPGCTHCTRSVRKQFSFHQLPTTSHGMRMEWIYRIRHNACKNGATANFKVGKNTSVCSAHFKPEDFSRTLNGRWKLRPGAVPCIFPESAPKRRRVGRKKKTSSEALTISCDDNQTSQAIGNKTGEPKLNTTSQLKGNKPSKSTGNKTSDAYRNKTDKLECNRKPDKLGSNKIGKSEAGESGIQSLHHDHTYPDQQNLEKKQTMPDERLNRLESILERQEIDRFGIQRITSDPAMLHFYTGFADYKTFKAIYESIQPSAENMMGWLQDIRSEATQGDSLPLVDQFLMFLCRVRADLSERELALRFDLSEESVNSVVASWASLLYFAFSSLVIWPPRDQIQKNLPEFVKATYSKARVVLECSEVRVEILRSKASPLESTEASCSSHTTLKGLVGLTPTGSHSFISRLYAEGVSDQDITTKSGILDLLEKGDQVLMTHEGFPMEKLLRDKGCTLAVIPPFLRDRTRCDARSNIAPTYQIARLRIHIERVFRRLKEFHIFDGVVPSGLAGAVNQIWTACCILANFQGKVL
ncbi:uncharacterized protein LOC119742998 isoform X1 [Patiria miniata]|uniref:THAP-type domain-containing protein n=1 Tax=Patiria miniata TaxID=46514 RepID=A0A914BIG5_PATMI|nr:uncharacterized protein LOC119742998 isoform X1 [Patiria miniata]